MSRMKTIALIGASALAVSAVSTAAVQAQPWNHHGYAAYNTGRLTTSYVGLRRLSNVNLMRVLLDSQGKELSHVSLSWKNARVRFDPDGTVYE